MTYLEIYCDLHNTRVNLGYTQEEISILTGISLPTIRLIENNKFVPSVRVAILLSIALDCKVEDLFWFVSGEDDLNV